MYQAIVFFDLDGTFLDNDKNVPAENIEAISKLKENNILPVISTGRNIFEIKYVMDEAGIDTVISANGSYVQYDGKKLKAEVITQPLLEELIDFANEQGDILAFYNNKTFALTDADEVTLENYRLLRLDAKVDPSFYKTNPVNFLNVFNFDKDKLYQDKFAGRLSLVRNNPRALDTMKWGVSKQTGIKILINTLGLQDIPTYAFGDQLNDLQMFDEVDYPVSMGNGHPEAKAKADFVTTSNMNHGIVNGLKHYNLIK